MIAIQHNAFWKSECNFQLLASEICNNKLPDVLLHMVVLRMLLQVDVVVVTADQNDKHLPLACVSKRC